MSFFGMVLTALVTLLHIYVFWRAYSLPVCKRFSANAFLALACSWWLVYYLARLFGGHSGTLPIALEFAAMHWMGSAFLLAVGFLLADVVTGFGFLFRKAVPVVRSLGLACGVCLVLIAHVQGLRPPVVTHVAISVADLPDRLDGTRIAVMADLHAGEMLLGPRWLSERVRQVQALQPDMVVLVGDLFERATEPETVVPVMRRLSAPLGVWAVRGNHDSLRKGRRDVTGEILAGAGIPLLENTWRLAAKGLVVAGIDDLTTARRRREAGETYLDTALKDRPPGVTLLLSHTPWLTERIAAVGVDLMISGHTHAGQIWPFPYLVMTRYPYIAGLYEIDGMPLYVNRGTGTWGPRMRLWAPGEITLITLRFP